MSERASKQGFPGVGIRDYADGAKAGIAGGIAMGILALVIAAFSPEIDPWEPVKHVAATFYGEAAIAPGFQLVPILVGTIVHLLASAVLGMIFVGLFRFVMHLPFDFGLPALVGGVYGMVVYFVANAGIERFNPLMSASDKPAFLMAHGLFGIVTGLAYAQLRKRTAKSA